MQPEFLFRIKNGKWFWKEPNGKEIVQNFLQRYNNKKRWIKCTFKVVRKPKTQEQLGYYYAAILPTIHQQLVEDGYSMNVMEAEIPIDINEADKIIKHFCSRLSPNKKEVLLKEENPKGLILNKRDMTKYQAMMFLNNCIFWAKDKLNCSIPEPQQ